VTDNDITGNVGLTDQVHPNSKGHKYIATYFMQKFAQNVAW
jgi:phospholipase/lecithinase/hemolysin